MTLPEFKPASCFLHDVNFPCLVAKVKNSESPRVRTRHLGNTRKDPICRIFLRSEDPNQITLWQQETLNKLFQKEGLAAALIEGMKDYERSSIETFDDLNEDERRQIKVHGFAPHLMISAIVIDDTTRQVLISAYTSFDCVLDEHGITIHLDKGRWFFEDGRMFDDYVGNIEEENAKKWKKQWATVFPLPKRGTPKDNDGSILYGVWRYNPTETANALKQLRASPREIKDARSTSGDFANELGMYFAPKRREMLSKGSVTDDCRVGKYERCGKLFKIHDNLDNPVFAPSEWWCDGERLILLWQKKVLTRTNDSYRKSKEKRPRPE